jgi:mannose-6-phosphate isomerase-like protein (cupin superfamily)
MTRGVLAAAQRYLDLAPNAALAHGRRSDRVFAGGGRRIVGLSVTMHKVNTNALEELTWTSPKGKFKGAGKEVSEALGRKPQSLDLNERHPFDVEILRIPPGATPYSYHSHSAQWEFYHVISGNGVVRHEGGTTRIEAGDAFIFRPGEAHQISSDPEGELVVYVVADNPIGESSYMPDSGKWIVRSPHRRIIRSADIDYFDGEE